MSLTGPTTNHEEIRSWADGHHLVPVEVLPAVVDHAPVELRLMPATAIRDKKELRMIAWSDFFCRFDLLGLTFVYDDDSTGYNELLQIEEKSPYRHPAYRLEKLQN